MKRPVQYLFIIAAIFIILLSVFWLSFYSKAQNLGAWRFSSDFDPARNAVVTLDQFNGYLNYWTNDYWKWVRYGNLFQLSMPNPEYSIAQNKLDMAEELGMPGFWMEEGFLNGLLQEPYLELDQPSFQALFESVKNGNVLTYVDPATPPGEKLDSKLPKKDEWKERLSSVQFNSKNYIPVKAYYLQKGTKKLFIVSSSSSELRDRVRKLIKSVENLLAHFDLHRGWFGAQTMFDSVTCFPGHPLEVIGKSMNQGNDWITFSGYMDYMLQENLDNWLGKVHLPFVADVGAGKATRSLNTIIYGCQNYDGLAPQDTATEEEWIKFAHDRSGYVFRPVYQKECDRYRYDGYIGTLGNKDQIDNEDIPFIIQSGFAKETLPPCMILFTDKGLPLTKARMYEAILSRRNAAVIEGGKMIGPELYRNALQMLLMDRIYLDEYFGEQIQLRAEAKGQSLAVTISSMSPRPVRGTLEITVPEELALRSNPSLELVLPPRSSRTLSFDLQPSLAAMDKDNPLAVNFHWEKKNKRTLAVMQLPPAISIHKLLYGHAPEVAFPVTVHNFTSQVEFPVKAQVIQKDMPSKVVFEATQNCLAEPGTFQTLSFVLQVPVGQFDVTVSALGAENSGQLAVGEKSGAPSLYEVDLDHDGLNEYRMENGSVRLTLLRIGARVIEYIVKERNDNLFFKLWPEKEDTDKRPFRKRGFYPYGGFEDFLGQASMETHQVYDAQILKKEGDYVQVKMTADYYGNNLEKIFTLYGNTPLLEVRFALTFRNPEANMLGPQPILELGERHWTEDLFFVPTQEGIKEFRMRPEEYYGRVLLLQEGWNAGYESREDTTFIGAFPVTQPKFLHMWMNHPSNEESHHYYAEFQPWLPIYQKSTMYFSYYIWGAAGSWQENLEKVKKMGLITRR
jgi:hypothetical protein